MADAQFPTPTNATLIFGMNMHQLQCDISTVLKIFAFYGWFRASATFTMRASMHSWEAIDPSLAAKSLDWNVRFLHA